MITQLRPPQTRPAPGNQLRISWSGISAGDTTSAKLAGSYVRRFDGFQSMPGLVRSGEHWLVDLDRLGDVESIDLELHASTTGSRTIAIADLHSDAEVEHVGLELTPRPEPYVFFRLVRLSGEWLIEAKDGDPDQVPLFAGGESIAVSIDRSASMIPWFESGAVERLLAALLNAVHLVDIPAIRVAVAGNTGTVANDTEMIRPQTDSGTYLRRLTETKRFCTGSAYVEAARVALTQAGGDQKVAVLVTDAPPPQGCASLASVARAVIAVVGVENLAEAFDVDHWNAISSSGVGVVPVGNVSSGKAAVNMLSRALNAS